MCDASNTLQTKNKNKKIIFKSQSSIRRKIGKTQQVLKELVFNIEHMYLIFNTCKLSSSSRNGTRAAWNSLIASTYHTSLCVCVIDREVGREERRTEGREGGREEGGMEREKEKKRESARMRKRGRERKKMKERERERERAKRKVCARE
jgi:hypothetical protein